jgi:trehalose/maltose transport system permease protein
VVAIIVLYTVFPFYWAIVSSLKSGSALFNVNLIPHHPAWSNYAAVFTQQPFGRNILNSLFVALSTVIVSLFLAVAASYALGRVHFRGRSTLLLVILAVSMFPQVAVLSGMFELIRTLGLYNNLLGLTLSYMIMMLPFTVWVLTTFMRELPKELEEAAMVDGAPPLADHPQGLPAADGARPGDDRTALLHRRLERVPVRPDLHADQRDAHGPRRHRAD